MYVNVEGGFCNTSKSFNWWCLYNWNGLEDIPVHRARRCDFVWHLLATWERPGMDFGKTPTSMGLTSLRLSQDVQSQGLGWLVVCLRSWPWHAAPSSISFTFLDHAEIPSLYALPSREHFRQPIVDYINPECLVSKSIETRRSCSGQRMMGMCWRQDTTGCW